MATKQNVSQGSQNLNGKQIMEDFAKGMLDGDIVPMHVHDIKSYANTILRKNPLTPAAQEMVERKRTSRHDYE